MGADSTVLYVPLTGCCWAEQPLRLWTADVCLHYFQGASQQGHAHQESHDSRVTQTCDSTDLRPFTLADDEDEHPPSAHTVQS